MSCESVNVMKRITLPKILSPKCVHSNLRIGSKFDGGYEINRDAILNSNFLLSFGVSEDWRFEKDFLKIKKVNLHMYDHTVTMTWLTKNALKNLLKTLLGKYDRANLGLSLRALFTYNFFIKNTNIVHFRKKIVDIPVDSSESNLILALDKTLSSDVFLKIDIEGSEYRILDQILDSKKKIQGLAIEFHDVDLFYDRFEKFINEMSKDFQINSININNFAVFPPFQFPRVLEVCMSRCSSKQLDLESGLRNLLCVPNNSRGPQYEITFS
jgi:hypothetical protein